MSFATYSPYDDERNTMTNRNHVPPSNPYSTNHGSAPEPVPASKPAPKLAAYAPRLSPSDVARAHAAGIPVIGADGQIVHFEEA